MSVFFSQLAYNSNKTKMNAVMQALSTVAGV